MTSPITSAQKWNAPQNLPALHHRADHRLPDRPEIMLNPSPRQLFPLGSGPGVSARPCSHRSREEARRSLVILRRRALTRSVRRQVYRCIDVMTTSADAGEECKDDMRSVPPSSLKPSLFEVSFQRRARGASCNQF